MLSVINSCMILYKLLSLSAHFLMFKKGNTSPHVTEFVMRINELRHAKHLKIVPSMNTSKSVNKKSKVWEHLFIHQCL